MISPENAMKIKVNGRNTRVKRIFAIPHAALRLNRKSFPKTQIIKIVKINDNIILPFCRSGVLIFPDIGDVFCSRDIIIAVQSQPRKHCLDLNSIM